MNKTLKSPDVDKFLKHNKWKIPLPVDLVLVSSFGFLFCIGFKLGFLLLDFFGSNYMGYEIFGDILLLLIWGIYFGILFGFAYLSSRGVHGEFAYPRFILIFAQIFAYPFVLQFYFDFNIIFVLSFISACALLYLILLWTSLKFPRVVNTTCYVLAFSFLLLIVIFQVVGLFGASKEEIEARREAEKEKEIAEFMEKMEVLREKHLENLTNGKGNLDEFKKEMDKLLLEETGNQ